MQLGVYAARDLTVTVEASAPKGPGALPKPTVAYGRYLPMRGYGSGSVWIQINHFRPEPTFTVGPDLARAVVVEIPLPADATAGDYAFDVAIAGGGSSVTVPVKLRVTAADLATIPIPVGLFSNALSFGPELVDEATWWRLQESLLREQTNAGLTMVTGGYGLGLAVAPDGTITGDAAIRYLKLAKTLGVTAAVAYGGFMPSAGDLRGNAAAAAKGVAALEAQGVPKLYVNSYDEPSTPAELAGALGNITGVTEAGLRTVGWTSAHWGDATWEKLIAGTHAPAFNLHDPEMYAKVRAMGREPWSYNNGPNRYGYSIHLYRQIKLGCMGRPDWIGNYVQGYAFNNLDGREPADCQFAVHREFGVLRTLAWLRSRQGLTDLRLLLTLEKKSPKDPILARVNDLSGWRSDQDTWTDAELDTLHAQVLARLDELGR